MTVNFPQASQFNNVVMIYLVNSIGAKYLFGINNRSYGVNTNIANSECFSTGPIYSRLD